MVLPPVARVSQPWLNDILDGAFPSGGLPRGVLTSIPGLYPLDDSSTPSPAVTTKNVSGHGQMFPVEQNLPHPRLRTTAVKSQF